MKISLKDFQAHEDSVIELADTLTAITGESDEGKSSIVRAIDMVRTNPLGVDVFIRNGEDGFEVQIDDVTRIKNSKLNAYKVKGHEKPFKALRGAVPEQVQDALNLSDENIQTQHDSIFLLNLPAGKVAKQLSSLTDLEPTTKALKIIADKKRAAKSAMDATETALDANEKEIYALRNTDDMHGELLKIERTGASVERLGKKYTTLYNAYINAVKVQNRLNKIPNTDALEPAKRLKALHTEITVLRDKENKTNSVLTEISSIEHQLSFDPSQLLRRAMRIETMREKEEDIGNSITAICIMQGTIKKLKMREHALGQQKMELIGDTCPLCERRIL